jgi:hypothetical protein
LVRCDGCGVIKYGSIKKIKCWSNWKLCRECAVKEHPEEYAIPYIKMVISKQKGIRKRYVRIGERSNV